MDLFNERPVKLGEGVGWGGGRNRETLIYKFIQVSNSLLAPFYHEFLFNHF